jgi:hypothetical protein
MKTEVETPKRRTDSYAFAANDIKVGELALRLREMILNETPGVRRKIVSGLCACILVLG